MSPKQKKYFEKQFRKNRHIPGRLANTRFASPDLAASAEKYVLEKIRSNPDEIVNNYDPNLNFKTYFTIRIQQLLCKFTKKFVYKHSDFLLSLSQSLFSDNTLAKEACEFILQQFEKNDWQFIRLYNGNADFCDYLSEISNRFLMEFPAYKVCQYTAFMDDLCKKQFNDINMANEASLYVLERLEKSNWNKIYAYNGKISFKNYLAKWIKYLLIDFYRLTIDPGLFPEKLKNQDDPVLRLVYEYLCIKRLNEIDITEQLNILGYDHATVFQLIEKINKDYPDCWKLRKNDISYTDFQEEDVYNQNHVTDVDHKIIRSESQRFIADLVKVFVSIFTDKLLETNQLIHDKDVMNICEKLMREFKPDAKQKEFLAMIHIHHIPIKDAAEKLNWSKRKAYRQREQLTDQIRNIIGEQNVKILFN